MTTTIDVSPAPITSRLAFDASTFHGLIWDGLIAEAGRYVRELITNGR